MRSKTGYWFEVIVKQEKLLDDGSTKKVNETYVTNAMSFSEAEKRIMSEVGKMVRGGLEVKKITPAAYKEVVFSDSSADEHWFKARSRSSRLTRSPARKSAVRFSISYRQRPLMMPLSISTTLWRVLATTLPPPSQRQR